MVFNCEKCGKGFKRKDTSTIYTNNSSQAKAAQCDDSEQEQPGDSVKKRRQSGRLQALQEASKIVVQGTSKKLDFEEYWLLQ